MCHKKVENCISQIFHNRVRIIKYMDAEQKNRKLVLRIYLLLLTAGKSDYLNYCCRKSIAVPGRREEQTSLLFWQCYCQIEKLHVQYIRVKFRRELSSAVYGLLLLSLDISHVDRLIFLSIRRFIGWPPYQARLLVSHSKFSILIAES